jgi:hypothetical protein
MFRIIIGMVAIFGVLALIALARDQSPSFETCIGKQSEQYGAAQQIKGSANAVVPLVQRWPFAIRCSGAFLDDNNAVIGGVATVIIAIFTIVLALASGRQANLTREALVADKRAFLFAIQISPVWEKVGDEYFWRVRPVWRNYGFTPTRKLRTYVDCEIRNSVLPPDFNFRHDPTQIGKGLMAPQYESPVGQAPRSPGAPISPQDILDVQQGRKFIYLWGWARYFDVFRGTPERVTHFCWFITAIGDPKASDTNSPPEKLRFHFVVHPIGNYADQPDN